MDADGFHHQGKERKIHGNHSQRLFLRHIGLQGLRLDQKRQEKHRQAEKCCRCSNEEPVAARIDADHRQEDHQRRGNCADCPEKLVFGRHQRYHDQGSSNRKGGQHHKEPAHPSALHTADKQADHHGNHQNPGNGRADRCGSVTEFLFLRADHFLPFHGQVFLYFILPDALQFLGTFRAFVQMLFDHSPAFAAAHVVRIEREQVTDNIAVSLHPSSSFPVISAGHDDM